MKAKFAQLKPASLFEKEETLTNLSALGNTLERLEQYIDFEMFRPMLEEALYKKDRKSNAGRKPMDPVFVCKALFLQRFYGLSDEQLEYQITDRMSFRRFLGIMNVDDVIDARTLWKYRDMLSEKGSMKGLVVRSIGLMRAKANVALTSLVYNMFRFIQIVRYKPEWVKI